jgi:hypothetical protein
MLSYPALLERATAETRQLKAELKEMDHDYFEIAVLGNRLDIRNLNDFNSRKKALFAKIILKEKEVERSQNREAECRRKIANGATREVLELVSA